MLQKIMARCDNDDDTESVNSDITNDINKQLKQSDLALTKKDNEILKLKAPMATASPNNHSTTIELILILSQALSLLIDPLTIKANTSKTITNIKANYPYQCNRRL